MGEPRPPPDCTPTNGPCKCFPRRLWRFQNRQRRFPGFNTHAKGPYFEEWITLIMPLCLPNDARRSLGRLPLSRRGNRPECRHEVELMGPQAWSCRQFKRNITRALDAITIWIPTTTVVGASSSRETRVRQRVGNQAKLSPRGQNVRLLLAPKKLSARSRLKSGDVVRHTAGARNRRRVARRSPVHRSAPAVPCLAAARHSRMRNHAPVAQGIEQRFPKP